MAIGMAVLFVLYKLGKINNRYKFITVGVNTNKKRR